MMKEAQLAVGTGIVSHGEQPPVYLAERASTFLPQPITDRGLSSHPSPSLFHSFPAAGMKAVAIWPWGGAVSMKLWLGELLSEFSLPNLPRAAPEIPTCSFQLCFWTFCSLSEMPCLLGYCYVSERALVALS